VKKILVGWVSGSWIQKCWDRFGWWPLRLGGGGGGNNFSWRPPWLGKAGRAPLNYTLAFALQLRKSTENLSQVSRVVGDYSLRRLGWLSVDSLGWPAEHRSTSVTRGWLQSALSRHRCLPTPRYRRLPVVFVPKTGSRSPVSSSASEPIGTLGGVRRSFIPVVPFITSPWWWRKRQSPKRWIAKTYVAGFWTCYL
jgi:hypothetical protein